MSRHWWAGWRALLLTIMACTIAAGGVTAQTERAAALLTARYFGVEVQRTATDQWFTIPPGAAFPVGTGDRLRTGSAGRFTLDWTPLGEQTGIVLPSTDLSITNLDSMGDRLAMTLELTTGRLIMRTTTERFEYIDIVTSIGTLSGTGSFAVQFTDERLVAVATAEALTFISDDGSAHTATPGSSLIAGADNVQIVTSPAVPTFTQVEAEQIGCPGRAAARAGANLNVRVGPAFGYDELGVIPNGAALRVVGISPDGQRYRIAYRSSYGWIITEGVQADCAGVTLPVFPYSHVEIIYPVINPTAEELGVLRPFFGPPEDDPWFYR